MVEDQIEALRHIDPKKEDVDEAPNDTAINHTKIIYNIIKSYHPGPYHFCAMVDGGIGMCVGDSFSVECFNDGLILAGYCNQNVATNKKIHPFVFDIDIGQTVTCKCDGNGDGLCDSCSMKSGYNVFKVSPYEPRYT